MSEKSIEERYQQASDLFFKDKKPMAALALRYSVSELD